MTRLISRNRRKFLFLAGTWIGLAGPIAIAQGTTAAPAPGKNVAGAKALEFDVFSIRPSKPRSSENITWAVMSYGYRAINQSLWTTIMVAYFPQGFPYWSNKAISGAPSWVRNDLYDIMAKVAPANLAEWQKQGYTPQKEAMLRAMLQSALAERCKLVLHRAETETPIDALVVGKHGPKLKEANPDDPPPSGAIPLSGGGMIVLPARGSQVQEVTFFHVSMASFVSELMLLSSSSEKRSIQDRTGLTGKYDFVLQRQDEGPLPGGQEGITASDPNPPISWNVEKLGLKVKPAKAPTETLVIDHIEKPTEN